jgi:thiol-disulfide isomerase/thioredoxin
MKRREFILTASTLALPLSAQAEGLDLGVVFMGASWCPHCHAAAPILAALAHNSGVGVLVGSFDGRPIEPFSEFVDASSHPLGKNVRAFPTTVVIQPRRDVVVGGFEGFGGARRYAERLIALLREGNTV